MTKQFPITQIEQENPWEKSIKILTSWTSFFLVIKFPKWNNSAPSLSAQPCTLENSCEIKLSQLILIKIPKTHSWYLIFWLGFIALVDRSADFGNTIHNTSSTTVIELSLRLSIVILTRVSKDNCNSKSGNL